MNSEEARNIAILKTNPENIIHDGTKDDRIWIFCPLCDFKCLTNETDIKESFYTLSNFRVLAIHYTKKHINNKKKKSFWDKLFGGKK